jgi:hypothetical protein
MARVIPPLALHRIGRELHARRLKIVTPAARPGMAQDHIFLVCFIGNARGQFHKTPRA